MRYSELVENEIDSIDASVFNGDLFLDKENREDFRNWLNRWQEHLKEYDQLDEIFSENDI